MQDHLLSMIRLEVYIYFYILQSPGTKNLQSPSTLKTNAPGKKQKKKKIKLKMLQIT